MTMGAERVGRALAERGVTHVFGVPGTQSVPLFEGLRRSPLRTVLTTHELNAAFMAVGFFRASGRPAALATIPGPGFSHALSGVIEARHDSAALLHLVGPPSEGAGHRFALQAIAQRQIGELETKGVFSASTAAELERAVDAAWRRAVEGEPGPVVLQLSPEALLADDPPSRSAPASPSPGEPPTQAEALRSAIARLQTARRPLLLVGQGAVAAADEVGRLAELLGAPVVTSCSGRGIVPEDHPLALGFDVVRSSLAELNALLAGVDCVLAVGYKFTHNGTAGFRLQPPAGTLIQVDAGPDVVGANYQPSIGLVADAGQTLRAMLTVLSRPARPAWTADELGAWRTRLSRVAGDDTPEPRVAGISPGTPGELFRQLRAALPRDGILVTDSGAHQVLARRYFPVLAPRGLLVPSDYQSMGFGIPAAIGARFAAPTRPVVAVVGDGGFAMSGMELLTAVREGLDLTVVVFNDGYLNQIRQQQLAASGRGAAVTLCNPDFEMLARAMGTDYRLLGEDGALSAVADARGVTVVEVRLNDSAAIRRQQYVGLARAAARRAVGPRLLRTLKRWLGR